MTSCIGAAAMPRLVPANDDDHDGATAPPFAWVDGHNGLDCQRWGDNVRRKVPASQEVPPPPAAHLDEREA